MYVCMHVCIYSKVKKQAERAKDLTERIKTKGLW